MKRLLAIAIVLTLATGMAFAQATAWGKVFAGGTFLQQTNDQGTVAAKYPTTGALAGDNYNNYIGLSIGDGTAGAKFGLQFRIDTGASPVAIVNDTIFAWWRPSKLFRFEIGRNADGAFGFAQISGWGFTSEQKNSSGVAVPEYNGSAWAFPAAHSRVVGWYDGTGNVANVNLTLYPIDNLTVSAWVPWSAGDTAAKTYGKFHVVVNYSIEDLGKVNLAWQNGLGYREANEYAWWGTSRLADTPKVYASFFLTKIENLAVDFGVGFRFPLVYEETNAEFDNTLGHITTVTEVNTNYPLEIGLGARYTAGDLTVRLRTAIEPSVKDHIRTEVTAITPNPSNPYYNGIDIKDTFSSTKFSFNINPSYKVKNMTVFFHTGFGLQHVTGWKSAAREGTITTASKASGTASGANFEFATIRNDDVRMAFKGGNPYVSSNYYDQGGSATLISWFVNPYVVIPAGPVRFNVGFRVWSDGIRGDVRHAALEQEDYGKPSGRQNQVGYTYTPLVSWAVPFSFHANF